MKSAFKGAGKKKTWVFNGFGEKESGTGTLRPSAYRNCDCRDGVLKGGVGFAPYQDRNGNTVQYLMNVSVTGAYVATVNQGNGQEDSSEIYFLGANGYLYRRDPVSGGGSQKVFVGPGAVHCSIKDEKRAVYNLFSGMAGAFGTLNGQTFKSLSLETLRGGCVCGMRYFLAFRNGELHYSAPLAPYAANGTDPHGTGVIYLPAGYGYVVGLAEDGGAAYIFFEKGIFKLTVSADASAFALKKVAYTGGTVCIGSQAATGKGILFLASDGAYRVRGESAEKICEHLGIGPCDTSVLCGVGYCDDLVLMQYQKKTANGTETKRLAIQADGGDGYYTEVYGTLSGNGLSAHAGGIYRYVKDEESLQRGGEPYFASEKLDFGTGKRKTLKKLRLKGKGGVRVGVKCDGRERFYTVALQDGEGQARLAEKGKDFVFTLYPSAGSAVEGMEITYYAEG